MRWLFVVAVLAACESPGRDATDAASPVDMYPDSSWNENAVPFTLTGTTPVGTLDFVQYRSVGFMNGFCQSGVYLQLTESPAYFSEHPELHINILLDPYAQPPPSGRISATATLFASSRQSQPEATTDQVFFDLDHAEIVQPNKLSVGGRVFASGDGWSFDFTIAETLEQNTCI